MTDPDLMFRPASELAEMVRSGEISARELVETSLERIEELNPALNAFVQVDAERALATADKGLVQPLGALATAAASGLPWVRLQPHTPPPER